MLAHSTSRVFRGTPTCTGETVRTLAFIILALVLSGCGGGARQPSAMDLARQSAEVDRAKCDQLSATGTFKTASAQAACFNAADQHLLTTPETLQVTEWLVSFSRSFLCS